ncbi:MAG: acyl-ACP--UDP-N-acetylglucosamine O-acyltransferase [Candidatus Kapaibacterium sp.]
MTENINIHPSAIVAPDVRIGDNVMIGPFVIIEEDVEINSGSLILSGSVLSTGTRIGNNCRIGPNSVIGTNPQDLKYAGEKTYTFIGDKTVVREFATINRGTSATGKTVVGSDSLIMTYSHVAHDCRIGDHVIMSNAVQLGGHVEIDSWVVLGGVAKVHQFCKVGKHAMVGADVYAVKDIAPYTLIGRKPPQVEGINKVGLRRRGFTNDQIAEIQKFYDILLFSGYNNRDGVAKFLQRHEPSDIVNECIEFIENSTRGIYR